MEITESVLYWYSLLDAINVLLSVVIAISGVMSVILVIIIGTQFSSICLNCNTTLRYTAYSARISFMVFIISITILIFLPSSTSYLAMKTLPSSSLIETKEGQELYKQKIEFIKMNVHGRNNQNRQ